MNGRRAGRWRFAGASFAGLLAACPVAHAEPTSESAKAEALFREATKLLAASDVPAACARFAESKRLEPGIGVTLYLGDCYERLGRTASAWGEFTAAEDLARRAHDPRARIAHDRATRLEPRLSKLLLVVDAGQDEEGLAVNEDGALVGPAQWGVPLPIDPGEHRVSATAPHRKPWEREIQIANGAGTVTVNVPALEPVSETIAKPHDPAPEPAEPDSPSPATTTGGATSTGEAQRIVALVTAGVGIAGLGVGAIFGLSAKGKLDDSNSGGCNALDECNAAGLAMRSDGLRDATISTVAFVAGGAALAGGFILYLSAPRARASRAVEIGATSARGGGAVLVTAHF
jgi:hypothetical protein